MSPGSESRVQSTTAPRGGCLDHLVDSGGFFQFSDEMYRQRIHQHKKRKLDDPVNTLRTIIFDEISLYFYCRIIRN